MSKLVVNRFRDFIQGLILSSPVEDSSNDGTNTTLVLCDIFNARAMPEGARRKVAVDGTDYDIVSVDYEAKSIIVAGVVDSPRLAVFPNPFFLAGTITSASQELTYIDPETKAPLVYFHEITSSKKMQSESGYVERFSAKIAFADHYNTDWTIRQQHYDDAIEALNNLADFVVHSLEYNSKGLDLGNDPTKRIVPKWGQYTRKGVEKKTFTEYFDAVELEFDLLVYDCNC